MKGGLEKGKRAMGKLGRATGKLRKGGGKAMKERRESDEKATGKL